MTTIVLEGHLFDTKCFNSVIDTFEENNVQFRVIEWELGNTGESTSTVSIQVIAKHHSQMDEAIEQVT